MTSVGRCGGVDAGGGRDDEETVVAPRRDERPRRRQRGDDRQTSQDFPQPHSARHRPLRQAEQSLQGND